MEKKDPKSECAKSQKKINLPTKISTNASLSVLTFAFFWIDLVNTNSRPITQRQFQKSNKVEPILIAEHFYDQNGTLEQSIYYQNGERIICTTPEAIEKAEKLKGQKRGIDYYLKIEETGKEMGIDFEKLNDSFKTPLESSFRRASEVLVWSMFLEKFFNLNTAQNVINSYFTLVNSLDYLPDMQFVIKDLMKLIGRNWRWKITWEFARQNEKVRNIWESKEKQGIKYLKDWKEKCQNQARTRWNERKENISINQKSLILRERLEKMFNL